MVIKDDVSEVHSDAFCKLMKAAVGKDSGTVSGSVGNKTAQDQLLSAAVLDGMDFLHTIKLVLDLGF